MKFLSERLIFLLNLAVIQRLAIEILYEVSFLLSRLKKCHCNEFKIKSLPLKNLVTNI